MEKGAEGFQKEALIWHEGALGDILLSLPSIRCIKKAGHRILLVSRGPQGRLLLDSGEVDHVSDCGSVRWTGLFTGERVSGLDRMPRIYCFARRPHQGAAKALAALYRNVTVIRCSPVPETSLAWSELEQTAGSCPDVASQELFAPLRLGDARVSERGRAVVAVHPGSGGSRKCWPWERYEQVIRALSSGFPVRWLFITGPAESGQLKDRIRALASGLGGDRARVVEGEPLVRLAAELGSALLYIGNDSGITHLAAWLGVTTIAVFGPTSDAVWAPPLPWVHTISPAGGLECCPCDENYRECPAPERCVQAVSVRKVLSAARSLLVTAIATGGCPPDSH